MIEVGAFHFKSIISRDILFKAASISGVLSELFGIAGLQILLF
jgi:hypothetical protein